VYARVPNKRIVLPQRLLGDDDTDEIGISNVLGGNRGG